MRKGKPITAQLREKIRELEHALANERTKTAMLKAMLHARPINAKRFRIARALEIHKRNFPFVTFSSRSRYSGRQSRK